MLRIRLVVAAALVACLGALGCATIADPALVFEVSQRRYTQLMRYTDFEHAAHYVAPDDHLGFRERTAALGDVRFTDYALIDVEQTGSTAKAQVQYTGYRASDPIVVSFVEEQDWQWEGGAWLVHSHIAEGTP